MKYKTIFMGTPEFSIPSLQTVFDMTDLTAIFTQPDKKRGRGQKLSASPVKIFGLEKNIEVHQPKKSRTGFNNCRCIWKNITTIDFGNTSIRLYKCACVTIAEISWRCSNAMDSNQRRNLYRSHNDENGRWT